MNTKHWKHMSRWLGFVNPKKRTKWVEARNRLRFYYLYLQFGWGTFGTTVKQHSKKFDCGIIFTCIWKWDLCPCWRNWISATYFFESVVISTIRIGNCIMLFDYVESFLNSASFQNILLTKLFAIYSWHDFIELLTNFNAEFKVKHLLRVRKREIIACSLITRKL